MRIAHLADLHLGFHAYNRLNNKGINQREADVFNAFREALTKIKDLQVELVLMAGDIFHVPRPSNLTIIQTFRELDKFQQDSSTEIVMIAGNHDAVRSSDNRCILELFKSLPRTHVASHTFTAIPLTEHNILVSCLPHNALLNLDEFAIQPNPDYAYNILMLHGTVDSDRVNDYGGHDVPRSLLMKKWDYIACGHYHSFTDLGNNAFYAGAIERTSNNIWAEANEAKGFIEVDLTTAKVTFHQLNSPRPTIDLPVINAAHLTPDQISQAIQEHAASVDITDKLVRQKIINFPRIYKTQLNHHYIRQLQTQATHYFLDLRSPVVVTATQSNSKSNSGLEQDIQTFLENYHLPAGIKREEFVKCGISYIQKHSY
ncbi:MAG: exonuclease SbcCD subunit D [Pseudanabaenaceae cyanobacterium]